MIYTPFDSLTDDELIASVCNDVNAMPREIELVSRVITLQEFLDDARAEVATCSVEGS